MLVEVEGRKVAGNGDIDNKPPDMNSENHNCAIDFNDPPILPEREGECAALLGYEAGNKITVHFFVWGMW
jgi:hypothetical protein